MKHLMVVAATLGGTAMSLLAITMVLNFLTSDRLQVTLVLLAGGAVFAVSFLVAYFGDKQGKRERAAGYTTSRLGYPNVEQVDEATGLIVRSAGEPLLSREVVRGRIDAFRTLSQGSRES